MRKFNALLAVALTAAPLAAQDSATTLKAVAKPRRGSEFVIPIASGLVPGLGQFIHRAPLTGAGYTSLAAAGMVLDNLRDVPDSVDFPRESRAQLSEVGVMLDQSATWLSSWDAFHRAVPALKRQGKYDFLPERESVPRLLSAPFDHRFLKRWTTWVDLSQTAVVTALVLSERKPGEDHYRLRPQDVGYAGSLSLNAAAGEEAWFRGYLLPLLYERTGRRFWLANATQAGVFAAGHAPDNVGFGAFLGGWALWEGWIVRRNDWSIRESIFHHFWFDVSVATAVAIAEGRPRTASIRVPTIRF